MALLLAQTESGLVEGQPAPNQSHSLFRGIPFAASTAGDNRWKAPQPAQPWEGRLQALSWPKICPQARVASEGTGIVGREFYVTEPELSEDCLCLNVWTPAKKAGEGLPVAVYIHGGGMQGGYSYLNAYDGDGFAKRGIVMVTIAYRLNIFGGFAHPDLAKEDPRGSVGSYSALDQAAAIKWVRRNIAAFGGDPETITLFGQSAGGFSVQTMLAYPGVRGDFKRAIMQSGGGLSAGLDGQTPGLAESYEFWGRFMRFAGLRDLAAARALPALELFGKYQAFGREEGVPMPLLIRYCSPKVDGYVHLAERSEYLRGGGYPEVDTMVGSTSQEMFVAQPRLPPRPAIEAGARLAFGPRADEFLAMVDCDDPSRATAFFQDPVGDMMTAGSLAWAELQGELGRKPSYLYYFTLVPPGAETAHHSAEHHYVFQTLTRSKRPYGGEDFVLSNQLADYWANFMKTGDPNGAGLPRWEPYTEARPEALIIARPLRMGRIPEREQVAFLKDFALGRGGGEAGAR